MTKLFYDLLPIALFFIAYKLYNIFVATGVAMAAVAAQVFSTIFIQRKKPDLVQWITLAMMLVLGSSTLLLHNEVFIKWKPTAVYWLLACLFAGSHWLGKKNLVEKLLEKNLSLPPSIWHTLNRLWVGFFLLMGILNLFIAYYFDTDMWVNFKLFGTFALTLIFMVLQGMIIVRYLPKDPS